MAETRLGTIDELLEGIFEDVDAPEIRYGRRSARQLLQVLQQRQDSLDNAGR